MYLFQNVLVVLTAEGWCNIFDIKSDPSAEVSWYCLLKKDGVIC